MDLYKAIQDLYAEKEKLERIIASLEELQRTTGPLPVLPKPAKRRGRKSMNPSERQEVSERMRKYWASRRQPKQQEPSGAAEQASWPTRNLGDLPLEIPQPVILVARAVLIPQFESPAFRHFASLPLRVPLADPANLRFRSHFHRGTLYLKLEQPSRTQHPVDFAYIILDDLAARNVLEHDHREREIELQPLADSPAPPPMWRHRG